MASAEALDQMYMDLADRIAQMSHATRAKVGSVLVKDDRIISYGWNGTPSGDDNVCEIQNEDGSLTTKPDVLHAESNNLMKLAATGGEGANGSVLYVTLSPCFECSKLIKQSKIKRVVFRDLYRDERGIDFLSKRGVIVEKINNDKNRNSMIPTKQIEGTSSSQNTLGQHQTALLKQSVSAEVSRLRTLSAIAGRPAPVQGPTIVEQPPVAPVQGPQLVVPPPVAPVQGPTLTEPVIIDDMAAALAAAGITLVNGVPVERPANTEKKPIEDQSYRSSFY